MGSSKNTSIYCFYYKDTVIPIDNHIYYPIMAGNAVAENKIGIKGDDTGISISEKNRYYSELTGIYWVWKNTKQDFTGSCHYRRYFTAEEEPFDYKLKRALYYVFGLYKKRYGLIYTGNLKRFRKKILNEHEILEIFKTHDAILPVQRRLKYSVAEHYRRYHNANDLKILKDIIQTRYPGYFSSFQKVLNSNQLYANNMFILPEKHFEKFMAWWFSIIFEFEKKVKLEEYQGYQQRIMGFIGERLLTVWFCHEELKVKELPVIYFKKIKY